MNDNMQNQQQYCGTYYFMGILLTIKKMEDQLVAAMPGVPDGFEIVLTAIEGDSFRLQGGPLDGSTATFTRNADGVVVGLKAGPFTLAKIDEETVETLPVTTYLLAPELELTPEKRASFDALLQSCLTEADGDWITYTLPYPKHEFVQYVSQQDRIIFHGSNDHTITTFKPMRTSMELHDESGRGNLHAIYGTHEGLWSMFFGVVDRARLKGSIRNGVQYFQNRAGETIAVYNFSINREQLVEQPFTTGALYFLPRDTFVRLKLTEESYANEWASEESVQPYAKLLIEPEDFPFLAQISGHDDSELLRLETLTQTIRQAATAATLQDGRLELTLPTDDTLLAQLREYVSLQESIMPAATFAIVEGGDTLRLVITSLPPAVQQIVQKQYEALLT